jgi:TatA/E family protein of Tat protein translocase
MDFLRLGPWEVLLILVIALLLFDPRKLPEIGRGLGRAIREFKRTTSELTRVLTEEVTGREDQPESPPRRKESEDKGKE